MKLLAVVILYNPDYEELRKNIYSYLHGVDHLVIWNNTPKLSNEECLEKLALDVYNERVVVMGDGENRLIAYPLNRAVEWGNERGFTHILTMDQDSNFVKFDRSHIEDIIGEVVHIDPSAIFFAVNYNNLVDKTSAPYTIPDMITSGTICDIEKTQLIGGFREDYGIDAVDIEVVYRANTKGYCAYVLPDVELQHQLGMTTRSAWGFNTLNYSAFRYYHITRNFLFLWRDYPTLFKKKLFIVKKIMILAIPKIILSEHDKLTKSKAIIKGIYHGLTTPRKPL